MNDDVRYTFGGRYKKGIGSTGSLSGDDDGEDAVILRDRKKEFFGGKGRFGDGGDAVEKRFCFL